MTLAARRLEPGSDRPAVPDPAATDLAAKDLAATAPAAAGPAAADPAVADPAAGIHAAADPAARTPSAGAPASPAPAARTPAAPAAEAPAPVAPRVADPAAAAAPAAAPSRPARRRRSPAVRLLMLAVPLAIAVAGGWAWLSGGRWVETDNAYVHQALVPVSAQVSGRISEVAVAQNQSVTAGQLLFVIDPEPYRLALARAEAELDQAMLQVAGLRAAHGVALAQLDAAQQVLAIRQIEYDRQAGLRERGLATPAAQDEAALALHSAQSQVELARRQVQLAAAALGGDPATPTDRVPSVRAAQAALDAAQRDLDNTGVRAPADGVIAQIGNLNLGQNVAAGAMVVSLVATGETWVEANFKETQLANLQPGQRVALSVDAWPGLTLAGTVESFSAATGAQYALIPAQNATGNWVKVVQRLPVRIAVTPDPAHPLRDGMSVNAAVDTGATRLERMLAG